MRRKKFSLAEVFRLTIAAEKISEDIDQELGALMGRIICGDDSAFPAAYDRLLILQRFDDADRLRRIADHR